jgi:hypothetical protein
MLNVIPFDEALDLTSVTVPPQLLDLLQKTGKPFGRRHRRRRIGTIEHRSTGTVRMRGSEEKRRRAALRNS